MSKALENRLAAAQMEQQIALANLRTCHAKKLLAYTNKNLESSPARKTGWTIPGPAERDLTNFDRRTAMAQARQLVEESPVAQVVLNAHLDFCVGEELYLSMRTADRAFNDDVEKRWEEAKDTLDIRELRRWGKLVRMWQARHKVDGDLGLLLVDGGERLGGGRASFVQSVEADRIWREQNKADDCGIEYDDHMRAVKYFIGPHLFSMANKSGGFDARRKSKPVDAQYFIFYPNFPQERAERKRGVSAFMVLLNLLKDIEETEDGMSQKIKNAAFIALLFRQLQATTEGSLLGGLGEEDLADELAAIDDEKPRYVALKSGTNIHAEDGQTVEILESKSPSSEYMNYLRHRLRLAGLPLGLPLEFVLLDSTSANFPGLMMAGQAMRRRMKPMQADLRNLCTRVFKWWLAREVEFNGLKVPKAIAGQFSRHRWIIPSGCLIDPKKETDAWATKIEKRLATRQRAIEEVGEGDDFEAIIDEISDEETYMDGKGVSYQVGDPGAPIANDPTDTEGAKE